MSGDKLARNVRIFCKWLLIHENEKLVMLKDLYENMQYVAIGSMSNYGSIFVAIYCIWIALLPSCELQPHMHAVGQL